MKKIWWVHVLTVMGLGSTVMGAGNVAYVINMDSSSVSVIDVDNKNVVVKHLSDGVSGPSAIALTPNGKYAYITNALNNTVSVVDIQSDHQVIQSITKDINCPYGIAITPDGKYAYIASLGNDSVTVIDIEHNNRVIQRFNQNIVRPYAIAITPNGKLAYVANLGNSTISIIDIVNQKQVGSITANISNPYAIAITPDGKYAYVTNGGSNSVSVIDIENGNQPIQCISKGMDVPYAIAINPNGKYAYVANYSGSIAIIDITNQNEVVRTITKGINHPYAISISPDGKYAYIANLGDNSMVKIDLEHENRVTTVTDQGLSCPYGIALLSRTHQDSQNPPKALRTFLFQKDVTSCYLHDEYSLFDESSSMIEYLKAFPDEDYVLCIAADTGKFCLDAVNDPIKNVLRQGMIWEPHVHEQVKKYALPGTTVLDIGAHIGTETILMARAVGKSGKVHTFEPQKKNFRELWANCLVNEIADRVQLYHMAIGGSHKTVEIGKIVTSSDGEVDEGGIGIWGGGDMTEMRTIDSFHFDNVSLIKIDVEGCENEVLDGMVETITRNKPVIVIEICGGWVWDTAPPDIKNRILITQKKLIDLGYETHHLNAWDYIAFPKHHSHHTRVGV